MLSAMSNSRPRTPTERDSRPDRDAAVPRDTTALRLAAVGVVVALVALGLSLRATLWPATGAAACHTVAWNAVPAADSLPSGWSIAGSAFTSSGVTSTLSGPAPADGSSAGTTVYTTVDCFGGDASEAIARGSTAARAAGQTVATVAGLGDEAYSTTDTTTGGMAIQFRRGTLVGYSAAAGSIEAADLQAIASVFDNAMARAVAGATPPPPASAATSPAPSADGSAAPSTSAGAAQSAEPSAPAPELEALLPESVDGTTLTRDSAVGADVLGTDAGVRSLSASLRSLGADPADLHIAEAYDPSGTLDLSILAFGIEGVDGAKLKSSVLTGWLSANDPGVKTSTVTLSGHEATAVDYGDEGAVSYVVVSDAAVVVIASADKSLATKAAEGLR